jgi:hypothetical protein
LRMSWGPGTKEVPVELIVERLKSLLRR